MNGVIPNFFVAGAPKCGTTALCYFLNQHPDIFIPSIKEPCFFGSDLHKNMKYFNALSKENYLSLFDNARQQRIGEGSTAYFYSRNAAKELKEFSPFASIILMIRNPADLMFSLHKQLLFQGEENKIKFIDALNAEKLRKSGLELPERYSVLESLFYSDVAKCYTNIKRYIDVFGVDKVHVIVFDDFKLDSNDVMRGVFKFLDVDSNFSPSMSVINESKNIRSYFMHKILYHPPKSVSKVINTILPKLIIRKIFVTIRNLNASSTNITTLDNKLRQTLNEQFKDEVKMLSGLIQRNLMHWVDNQ